MMIKVTITATVPVNKEVESIFHPNKVQLVSLEVVFKVVLTVQPEILS